MKIDDPARWWFRITHRDLPIHEDGIIVPVGSIPGIDLALAFHANDGTDDVNVIDEAAWFYLDDARRLRDELTRVITLAEEHREEDTSERSRVRAIEADGRLRGQINEFTKTFRAEQAAKKTKAKTPKRRKQR